MSTGAVNAAETANKPGHVVTVTADRPEAIYRRGEVVTFVVHVNHEGKPVEAGEIAWVLSKDGVEPRRTGRATLAAGKATVTGTLDELAAFGGLGEL